MARFEGRRPCAKVLLVEDLRLRARRCQPGERQRPMAKSGGGDALRFGVLGHSDPELLPVF